jgi:hypothetical protein
MVYALLSHDTRKIEWTGLTGFFRIYRKILSILSRNIGRLKAKAGAD